MSNCRSCDAKIEFVKTKKGNWMPVDPEYIEYNEAEEGDVLITDEGNLYTVDCSKDFPSVRGRISHFATCPNADEHRKKNKKEHTNA